MRNIWQIVVAVILVGGGGIAVYNAVDDDRRVQETNLSSAAPTVAARPAAETAQTAVAGQAVAAETKAPTPDKTFSDVAISETDFALGEASAPVTVIEYASLTCPHCAQFHNEVLPAIKRDYIDSGKVRLIYRDFPLDRYALAASMLARCSGRERFFGFLDVLFRNQARWSRAQNPIQSLGSIAKLGGLSETKFQECLQDEALQQSVLQQRMDASQKFQVNSTPTLIINGRRFSGGLTAPQMRAVIDSLLPKS